MRLRLREEDESTFEAIAPQTDILLSEEKPWGKNL